MLAAMPAFVDAWLMKLFPGRTPEELDGIDILRLLRALQVKRLMVVEEKSRLFTARKLKVSDITPDDWRVLQENDRLERWLNDQS